MEERTRAYLRGRFGDHYRTVDVGPPPAPERREWGFVPWTEGPGETMVRHRSLLDLGVLEDFLVRRQPKHVYFSAGRYEEPAVSRMDDKNWLGSDLVFDLDADHLPSVDPATDSYATMLGECKAELLDLLDFLETDFAFEDLTVVFSGGRGYHVHVRDDGVQGLDRSARREIVDYVRGTGVEMADLTTTTTSAGVTQRTLQVDGGWGQRVHRALLDLVDELSAASEADAKERLLSFEGIGEGRAETVYGAIEGNRDAIERGNLEAGGVGLRTLVEVLTERVRAEQGAAIDEPVTTDTNRLIRLPGSLHGGSGLAVRRIDRDAVDDFDPLVDAVPGTFTDHDIAVEVTDGGTVELGGDSFTVEPGVHSVPEHVGVFLMARGRAEKGRE